ncbi:MAG TPA: ATP-binding protein [Thermoanaerobaculia bacterium]|nr:ATP-binding protein [Thermoanaerobaculia bacterium]
MLQPLVENAIRHGVAPRAGGGTIAIRAAGERGELVIEVSDDGPGPGTEEPVPGIGLQNVLSRLHQLYGDAASLVLARSGDRTIATLRMPARSDVRLASAG